MSAMRGFAATRLREAVPTIVLALAYLAVYLLLDRISFLEALYGIDITPWNPPPGLTVALLVMRGLAYTPLVFVAALLSSELIPQAWGPPAVGIAGALV